MRTEPLRIAHQILRLARLPISHPCDVEFGYEPRRNINDDLRLYTPPAIFEFEL